MKKSMLATHLFIFFALALNAQEYEDKNYNWEPTRALFTVTAEEEKHPAAVMKRYTKVEYAYDEKQGGSPFIYKTFHVVIRVNNADGIDSYNKIYISMEDVIEMPKVKARTINKAGKITELKDKDIIDVGESEESEKHKTFALEGLEPGSEIEYFYISKSAFSLSGREYFQASLPWKNIDFSLVTPENLVFEHKGYNGMPKADTSQVNGKNYIKLHIDAVEAAEDEEYAPYNNIRMRMEYFLAYNTARSRARIYTLAEAAEKMYDVIAKTETAEKKSVDALVKELKLPGNAGKEQKIKELENYLKNNIMVYTNVPSSDIPTIMKNKYASELGIMRVYAAALKTLGINYQIVMTSDRSKTRFDPDLDAWSTLDKYLIYFPETDNYLSPQRVDMRYGMVPYYFASNHGLFIRAVSLGGTEKGLGKVNFIPPLPYEKNYDDLDISITFSGDDKQEIKVVRKMGGLSAMGVQPVYSFLTKEKQKELGEDLIKGLAPDADFVSLDVKNGERGVNLLEKPFIITATVKSSALIERAGNRLLFKIGEVIGEQHEMYEDKDRKYDVENDFNRQYIRKIQFTIPDNYVIKNLDDLKMDVSHSMDGKKVFVFESNYKVSGNTVTVNVIEYYSVINCPKSEFQQFRSVINAAADFNKIVLVMEKR